MCGHARRGQKKTSNPQDLKLQLIVSCWVWAMVWILGFSLLILIGNFNQFVIFLTAEGSAMMSTE